MSKYVLILFLFTCACAMQIPEFPPVVDINPAFQVYVDDFVTESVNQNRPVTITNLIIQFSNQLPSQTLGECTVGGFSPTISINSVDWANETDIFRKVVLFHELGHCVLNREHVNTGSIYNGVCSATSIMWPYTINATNMYTENWGAYMQELFTEIPISAAPCSFNNYWGGI